MFRFGITLTPVRIISYATILMMLTLTGAVTNYNNPINVSIGYAHAQSDETSTSSSSSDENKNNETSSHSSKESSTTATTNEGSAVLRGIIGSTLSIQKDQGVNSSSVDSKATTTPGDDYFAAGRWRLVVENGTLDRFVAHFGVAKSDGSDNHDIVIAKIGPASQFTGNASRVIMQISIDGSSDPATVVPISLELHGKVLRISNINMEEGKTADSKQGNILRIIDGQTINGMIESGEVR